MLHFFHCASIASNFNSDFELHHVVYHHMLKCAQSIVGSGPALRFPHPYNKRYIYGYFNPLAKCVSFIPRACTCTLYMYNIHVRVLGGSLGIELGFSCFSYLIYIHAHVHVCDISVLAIDLRYLHDDCVCVCSLSTLWRHDF
jgi:hypothetical protein